MKRRDFVRSTVSASALTMFGVMPLSSFAFSSDIDKLTILHTNDVHSRIDPFPDNHSRYSAKGGAAMRKTLIDRIRKEESNVLLLDSGDMIQGTPYFNLFNGELEFKLMSAMKYDASTLGNHDFDGGMEMFTKQIEKNASFSILNCNYEVSDTPLSSIIKEYQVFQKGSMKIGVTGVGIELNGLVPHELCTNVQYRDPISHVNSTCSLLKNELNCDLVIVLSHLGLKYKGNRISDFKLAKMSENIDVILGGHTHSFLDKPIIVANANNRPVMVNQVGWAGLILGRINVYFKRSKKQLDYTSSNEWVYQ